MSARGGDTTGLARDLLSPPDRSAASGAGSGAATSVAVSGDDGAGAGACTGIGVGASSSSSCNVAVASVANGGANTPAFAAVPSPAGSAAVVGASVTNGATPTTTPLVPPGRVCESCDVGHAGTYGSGRFCSAACAKKVGARTKWAARAAALPQTPRRVPPVARHAHAEAPCEACDKHHDRTYGSGRFCSVHCARRVAAAKKWQKCRSDKFKRLDAIKPAMLAPPPPAQAQSATSTTSTPPPPPSPSSSHSPHLIHHPHQSQQPHLQPQHHVLSNRHLHVNGFTNQPQQQPQHMSLASLPLNSPSLSVDGKARQGDSNQLGVMRSLHPLAPSPHLLPRQRLDVPCKLSVPVSVANNRSATAATHSFPPPIAPHPAYLPAQPLPVYASTISHPTAIAAPHLSAVYPPHLAASSAMRATAIAQAGVAHVAPAPTLAFAYPYVNPPAYAVHHATIAPAYSPMSPSPSPSPMSISTDPPAPPACHYPHLQATPRQLPANYVVSSTPAYDMDAVTSRSPQSDTSERCPVQPSSTAQHSSISEKPMENSESAARALLCLRARNS